MNVREVHLRISGMTCPGCARTVERIVHQLPGVAAVEVAYPEGTAVVRYDPAQLSIQAIIDQINSTKQYRAVAEEGRATGNSNGKERHFDLIIIGGGSAAFAAAIEAHRQGLQTLVVNAGLPMGGTCVNVGCIPSKFLVEAAHQMAACRKQRYAGITADPPDLDYAALQQQLQQTVQQLRKAKYADILETLATVTWVEGWATFVDPHTIRVGETLYTADAFLIATGSEPAVPPIPGIEAVPYLTNETLFDVTELPSVLAIIGGGAVGVELAQAFARFGSQVVLIEMQPSLLPPESPDIGRIIQQQLEAEGVQIYTAARVESVSAQGNGTIAVTVDRGGEQISIAATHLLIATGRRGRTQRLGLEQIGVETDAQGKVVVNEYLQSSVPHIYAAGDCNQFPAFVYTAAAEGRQAVQNFTGQPQPLDYTTLPWVIFTDPQVAGVGKDTVQLEQQGRDYEVTELPLAEVPRAIVSQQTDGFIRLVRDPATDLLLGARIVAPAAGELIVPLQWAMRYRIPVTELAQNWCPYLTFAEGMKLAALSFEQDVRQLSCCAV